MESLALKKIFRNFLAVETKVADGAPRTLVVKISSPTPDRSKDTVQPSGMDAKNFLKNPVVMYAHNYSDLPIAKCTGLKSTDEAILATVQFPDEGVNAKADTVYKLYKGGFLNAWSIGFMPLTDGYEENDQGGYNFTKWELFEFSAVPVPDNPEALTIMRSKGINVDQLLEKGVIGYKETPKAAEDEAWDAGAEVKAASVEDLKVMCTWFDSDNADNKGAYKLPHHKQADDHAVVWRGVAAAMGALLGARGGTKIPDGDRKGCYNHLAKHYAQFEKEVPDFKDYSDELIAKITEGTFVKADDETEPYTDDTKLTDLTVADLKDILEDTLESGDDDDAKGAKKVIAKDINEVIALSYVLDELHYFIRAFQQAGVNQDSIDKLQQALGLVMEVTQMQAVIGSKSITLKDFTVKTGRTISAKHEAMLSAACDYMTKATGHVQTVLDSVQEQDDNDTVVNGGEAAAPVPLTKRLVKQVNEVQKNMKEADKQIGLTLRLVKIIKSEHKKEGGE